MPDVNISMHFERVSAWINEAIEQQHGKVLVHCAAGVSRSASLVLAFLIRHRHMKYDDAFALLKKARSCVCPNFGFVRQLRKWERDCLGCPSPPALAHEDEEHKVQVIAPIPVPFMTPAACSVFAVGDVVERHPPS